MLSKLRHACVMWASHIAVIVLSLLSQQLAHAQGLNSPRWTPAPPRVAVLESPDRGDRAVTIVPAAVPREVLRLHDAIFRIDVYENNDCVGQGTGFSVTIIGRRVLIATCAHVLEENRLPKLIFKEDEDGQTTLAFEEPVPQQKTRTFKVVQRGDGRSYDVSKTYLHPQRQDDSGPDVAIVEIEIPVTHPLPPTFALLPRDDREPLHGQTVHLLGLPGISLPDMEPDAPFYGRGMVSQVDKLQRWISYDMAAGAGASGSPLFILRPNRWGGQAAYVVGIHACGQRFDKLSCAVHVDRIADVIDQVPAGKPLPKAVVIRGQSPDGEQDTPWSIRDGVPAWPTVQNGEGSRSGARPTGQVKTLSQIRELARQGFPYLALRELDKLVQSQEQAGRPVPIEYDVLRAKLLIDHGNKLNGDSYNRRVTYKIDGQTPVEFVGSALGQFTEAIQILERIDAPSAKDRGLYLLYLRAAANKGRVLKEEQNDRSVLEETHRLLHDLVRNERLSTLNQARCQFLLGFVHYHLGFTAADLRRAESDFTQSYRLFPSRQTDDWLGHLRGRGLISTKPDLWDTSEIQVSMMPEARSRSSVIKRSVQTTSHRRKLGGWVVQAGGDFRYGVGSWASLKKVPER